MRRDSNCDGKNGDRPSLQSLRPSLSLESYYPLTTSTGPATSDVPHPDNHNLRDVLSRGDTSAVYTSSISNNTNHSAVSDNSPVSRQKIFNVLQAALKIVSDDDDWECTAPPRSNLEVFGRSSSRD